MKSNILLNLQLAVFSVNEEVDENGERRIELRDDNPFLHDNVD